MEKLKDLAHHLHPSPRMPVLFVGHGNPMNAILDTDITRTWQRVGGALPPAQAIVVISAHWLTKGTHITDAPKQPIIYDMYGFPDELYQVTYDAAGDPQLAALLQQALLKYEAQLDSTWGLDHGTWSVLKHLAPHPNIPILQISLDFHKPLPYVIELFSQLKELRHKGVIFIGSGNIVHNLRALDFSNRTPSWALEFDDLSSQAIRDKNVELLTKPNAISHAASLAVPTDDHYRPMLAAMALLDADESIDFFNTSIDLGSVSMRSFISA